MTDLSVPLSLSTPPRSLPNAQLPDSAALLAKPLPALRNAFNQW